MKNTAISIVELIRGLLVTFKHLFVPAVTLQYPARRWQVSDRFRGVPCLSIDNQEKERCVGCCLCARICPSQAIRIRTDEGEDYQKVAVEFEIDIGRCIYCGLCVEACPKDAIHMSGEYELSSYDRAGTIYHKEILYHRPEIKRYK